MGSEVNLSVTPTLPFEGPWPFGQWRSRPPLCAGADGGPQLVHVTPLQFAFSCRDVY